jgi:hypothetical protein
MHRGEERGIEVGKGEKKGREKRIGEGGAWGGRGDRKLDEGRGGEGRGGCKRAQAGPR